MKNRYYIRSEDFFVICDEATGLAEKYSQKKPHPYHCLKIYHSRYCCIDAVDRI